MKWYKKRKNTQKYIKFQNQKGNKLQYLKIKTDFYLRSISLIMFVTISIFINIYS